MDILNVIRTIEGFKFDARQAKDAELVEELDECLRILTDARDFKYCDGCKCYKEKDFFRGDYCEVCTVAAQHLRESEEMGNNLLDVVKQF